ncbi:DUF4224 domain-containing protein [Thiobacillus sp.]|uniref:DUF4224 domain-containing protein n=1 Tax=Thiobacillus sp. TaxID=924 RepID=UPI00184A1102|nr:DUF4224 domain-containing protein [Thiobacillus sp.]MBC2731345.1 DUF4224 domain-containing protein [Thiobacillus sp.]MBC2740081.1 DUF4224 domain-containing protein [Thiobacillus sp.]MBC2758293.1 DUF4224 domain-containing protein [Thiobacillus sp.]
MQSRPDTPTPAARAQEVGAATPFLSDAEMLHICKPLTQPAAMIRYLKREGFNVKRRPDGWPLISRANYDAVMMGQAQPAAAGDTAQAGPNVQALLDRFRTTGAPYGNGTKEKKQPAGAT